MLWSSMTSATNRTRSLWIKGQTQPGRACIDLEERPVVSHMVLLVPAALNRTPGHPVDYKALQVFPRTEGPDGSDSD